MRTTITLDDALVARAKFLTGIEETPKLIRAALKALVEHEAARRLARLGGSDLDMPSVPRRQTEPFGMSPPSTFLSRADGALYSIVTAFPARVMLVSAVGLNLFSVTFRLPVAADNIVTAIAPAAIQEMVFTG